MTTGRINQVTVFNQISTGIGFTFSLILCRVLFLRAKLFLFPFYTLSPAHSSLFYYPLFSPSTSSPSSKFIFILSSQRSKRYAFTDCDYRDKKYKTFLKNFPDKNK